MILGVFSVLFAGRPLNEVVKYCSGLGLKAIELTTVGYPEKAHINVDELLSESSARHGLLENLKRNEMEISALGCAGNHVHPKDDVRDPFQALFRKTIHLAEMLGIERVVTFSGCPGDSKFSLFPNWVTCPWPNEYLKILDYQWTDVLLPYWEKTSQFAKEHGVEKICIEMHPGFCVYNPETLLRLRSAVGNCIGANFDPSHLFWQGIDPAAAVIKLGPAIFHVHAKDTKVEKRNTDINGVLDTKHYREVLGRAWTFRTVGYGHSREVWKELISTLRMIGYDYVLSIEHEDPLMSVEEGLGKAVSFLQDVMISHDTQKMWWA